MRNKREREEREILSSFLACSFPRPPLPNRIRVYILANSFRLPPSFLRREREKGKNGMDKNSTSCNDAASQKLEKQTNKKGWGKKRKATFSKPVCLRVCFGEGRRKKKGFFSPSTQPDGVFLLVVFCSFKASEVPPSLFLRPSFPREREREKERNENRAQKPNIQLHSVSESWGGVVFFKKKTQLRVVRAWHKREKERGGDTRM